MMQQTPNEQFYAAWRIFASDQDVSAINTALVDLGLTLAGNVLSRVAMGEDEPSIWPPLQDLWGKCDLSLSSERIEDTTALDVLALGKFTRNLVAAVEHNQHQAYAVEPCISALIYKSTSALYQQDEAAQASTRMLTQALSNMLTGNDDLATRFLDKHLNIPEERNILLRLLGCHDPGTVLSVLVLILNAVHGNRERLIILSSSPLGIRAWIGILDQIYAMTQLDESPEADKAFNVGYRIFTQIAEQSLVGDLYKRLAVQNEVTTPHQTTFLKMIDSHLQSPEARMTPGLVDLLFEELLSLSQYARKTLRRSLGPEAPPPTAPVPDNTMDEVSTLRELDLLLPKVCEALVLLLQCLLSALLGVEHGQWDTATKNAFSNCTAHARSIDNLGAVESVIDLLRLLDIFLPRITLGKVVLPGHANNRAVDSPGFAYLKRDITRFVGTLAHGSRDVQDRMRICGGIPALMNMCVVDDQNPYLREHAIFALRNALRGNEENQALVKEIKPMGQWDADGILRDMPGAVRR